MKRQRSSAMYLLIECSIALLFFTIAALICMNLEAKSSIISKEVIQQRIAMQEGANIVDALQVGGISDLAYEWEEQETGIWITHAHALAELRIQWNEQQRTITISQEDHTLLELPYTIRNEALK